MIAPLPLERVRAPSFTPSQARRSVTELFSQAPLLRIGLINNMRGAGFAASKRQFSAVLDVASDNRQLALECYVLPGLPSQDVTAGYSDLPALLANPPDGLIVTGAEPATDDLAREACFPALTKVIEAGLAHGTPTIFSCLAAHTAVLYLSGIVRRRLAAKRHGVFTFTLQGDHKRNSDGPDASGQTIMMPHSRWNDLDASALTRHGYRILTMSDSIGVDAFVHPDAPGCLFFQGHPEYEAGTLPGEYRRDVKRFLNGTAPYPTIPLNCFDTDSVVALERFETAVRPKPKPELISAFPVIPPRCDRATPWQASASGFYRQWLDDVAAAAYRRRHAEC